MIGAEGGIRTHTGLLPTDFKYVVCLESVVVAPTVSLTSFLPTWTLYKGLVIEINKAGE